jgi:glycosyltransferase involved in cell wall biosynthesis
MPTVSVIIPSYDSAKFVVEALDSVLNQTYHDLEVIVVDDGSRDNTEEAVKDKGERMTYVRQDNVGASAARNHGIRVSSGNYIAFLDADDLWKPNKLEEQVRILDDDPEVGLVCSDWATVAIDGSVQNSYLKNCRYARSGYVFNEVIQEYFILTSSVLLRRSCLSEVGVFDEALMVSEDKDLWLRVCHRWKIKILPEPLVVKRNRPSNLSSDPIAAVPFRIRLFEKLLRTIPNLPAQSRRLIREQLSVNYFDLGCDYFSKFMKREARSHLRSSLNWRWTNGRAFAYLLACYLPTPVVRTLRAVKQAILQD